MGSDNGNKATSTEPTAKPSLPVTRQEILIAGIGLLLIVLQVGVVPGLVASHTNYIHPSHYGPSYAEVNQLLAGMSKTLAHHRDAIQNVSQTAAQLGANQGVLVNATQAVRQTPFVASKFEPEQLRGMAALLAPMRDDFDWGEAGRGESVMVLTLQPGERPENGTNVRWMPIAGPEAETEAKSADQAAGDA